MRPSLHRLLGTAAVFAAMLALAAPAAADEEYIFTDNDYTDSSEGTVISGFGQALTLVDTNTGIMQADVSTTGIGHARGEVRVWRDFTVAGQTGTYTISGEFDWLGDMSWNGKADASVYVYLLLEDLTDEWIKQSFTGKESLETLSGSWSDQRTKVISFEEELKAGNDYKISLFLVTDVDADITNPGTADVDFYDDGDGNGVDLNRFRVYRADTLVNTSGGTTDRYTVQGEYIAWQDSYDEADKIDFRSTNDTTITGWDITIEHFTTASSAHDPQDDYELLVDASGQTVAQGKSVKLDITHWIHFQNAMGLEDVVWREAPGFTADLNRVMPNHRWDVAQPVPAWGEPGVYAHDLTMINTDPDYTLEIGGLQLLTTAGPVADLAQLDFTGPLHDLSLAPGASTDFTVKTTGQALGGYVHFKYDITDVAGVEEVCNAFGSHYIDDLLPSPWTELAVALAGTNGKPVLTGDGTLVGGETAVIALSNALPGAQAYLIMSPFYLGAPFKFGIMVPQPDIVIPVTIDPLGEVILAFPWPIGLPSGVSLYWQYWISDAGGIVGFASSSGLQSTTP